MAIPIKIREYLSEDPFMVECIHKNLEGATPCSGRIEWEHSLEHKGRQINEKSVIVPCCTFHHRGNGLIKEFNRYIALIRTLDVMQDFCIKYPKRNFMQEYNYLNSVYGSRLKQEIDKVPEM